MDISKIIKQDTINGVFVSTIMMNPLLAHDDQVYETMVQYPDDRETEIYRCRYYVAALEQHDREVKKAGG